MAYFNIVLGMTEKSTKITQPMIPSDIFLDVAKGLLQLSVIVYRVSTSNYVFLIVCV